MKLTIHLFKEKNGWFAEGIEIAHFSQGTTEEECLHNFNQSFHWTKEEHMKVYGHTAKMRPPLSTKEKEELKEEGLDIDKPDKVFVIDVDL